MRTPAIYSKMVKEGYITKDVLGEVLYSINKRAKNYRDKKRKYMNFKNDRYNNFEKAEEQEEVFYSMKDNILKNMLPVEIHKDTKIKKYTTKVYDYEEEYYTIKDEDIIRENSYYDRELDSEVEFKIVAIREEIVLYFKYYKIGKYDFHTPVKNENIDPSLPLKELNNFETYGKDINELLSVPFCKKVYEMLQDNKLKIEE
ncbi:hypothetical protein [uncultured Clostridium sp.]|uniref:hypothetical protein n=1 Tax=uncultured Clostridium sp. TaxID=59620 RepID=UPI00260221A7|nr:hypothetical protein [uncultured Clostridium sp.]